MSLLNSFNKSDNIWIAPEKAEICPVSNPVYKKQKDQSKICIVLGSAPCAFDDLCAALIKYPKAVICGINEAVSIDLCTYLVTCHGEKLPFFIEQHRKKWGILNSETLVDPICHILDTSEAKALTYPAYRWTVNIGAGSAAFAGVVMHLIGFEKIIFCGCPMDGGGGYAVDTEAHDEKRFGYLRNNHAMIKCWHKALKGLKRDYPEICAKFRSMSGFTRELFGEIK